MEYRELRFSNLSPEWQSFVREMQFLNFGYFINLGISYDGEPIHLDDSETIETHRFPGMHEDRPECRLEDFILPAEVVDLIAVVEEIPCRRIRKLQVRHGLPFQVELGGEI